MLEEVGYKSTRLGVILLCYIISSLRLWRRNSTNKYICKNFITFMFHQAPLIMLLFHLKEYHAITEKNTMQTSSKDPRVET